MWVCDIGRAFELVQLPETSLEKEDGEILAMHPGEEELERLLHKHLRLEGT
jgi:hypothetical protein